MGSEFGSSLDENIAAFRTSELHFHADPEWKRKDLKTLFESVLGDTGAASPTKWFGMGGEDEENGSEIA